MEYKSYQHVERLGRADCEGVLEGIVYVQPKIDGTNSCVWLGQDLRLHAGSRRKELSLENDNAGFYATFKENRRLIEYLLEYPERIIYGEWLVPHTIKSYRPDAWRKFYIFDVYDTDEHKYLPFSTYAESLENYIKSEDNIEIVPLMAILENPTQEGLTELLKSNHYLMDDPSAIGEGIVLKNYNYSNKYGRTIWGKIVAEEFFGAKKSLRTKNHETKTSGDFEEMVANKYITEPVIRKEFAKVLNEVAPNGEITRDNQGKIIGMTLNKVYDAFLEDELLEVIRKNKKCTINFLMMRRCSDSRVKEVLKEELF